MAFLGQECLHATPTIGSSRVEIGSKTERLRVRRRKSLVSEELARDSFLLFSKLYLFYLIVSITSVIIRKVLMVAGKPMWGIQLMTVATTVSGVLPALRQPKKWECS